MTEEAQQIERIINKHVHDVRNSMTSLYYEAVLLGELNADPEVASTVKRMRAEITQLEATLKALQYKFSKPAPLTLSSAELLDLWQRQMAALETADRQIAWSEAPVPRDVFLDAQAVLSIMRELFLAAWVRAPASQLKAALVTRDQCVALELRVPASGPPPAAEALEDQRRLVAIHGGTLAVSEAASAGERIFMLSFPSLPPKPAV